MSYYLVHANGAILCISLLELAAQGAGIPRENRGSFTAWMNLRQLQIVEESGVVSVTSVSEKTEGPPTTIGSFPIKLDDQCPPDTVRLVGADGLLAAQIIGLSIQDRRYPTPAQCRAFVTCAVDFEFLDRDHLVDKLMEFGQGIVREGSGYLADWIAAHPKETSE